MTNFHWDAESYWAVTAGERRPDEVAAEFELRDKTGIERFFVEAEREAIAASGGEIPRRPTSWAELRREAVELVEEALAEVTS